MKRPDILYRTAALLSLVTLAAACSHNNDFPPPTVPGDDDTTAVPLTIAVSDGAFAPAQATDPAAATRAVESAYGTTFTEGDRIGLYAVEVSEAGNPASARKFLFENLCLTHNGAAWTLPDEEPLMHRPPAGGEILYFAYYPYQDEMTGRVRIDAPDETADRTEAEHFFGPLVAKWEPAYDQSTYEAYTASDLMVALGEVEERPDGSGAVLRFSMEHQMGLGIIRWPTTRFTYQETIDGVATQESYRLYDGVVDADIFWKENCHSARYLINISRYFFEFTYYNAALEKRSRGVYLNPARGKYKLVVIDGGAETVVERPLREGDFYMKDGTVIPQENVGDRMPAEVQNDCIGVVHWVGENEGMHWTQTGNQRGDQLLMYDHPECTRAMVVALRDASAGAQWATGSGAEKYLWDWANGFDGFSPEEDAEWDKIFSSAVTHYGYAGSRLTELYETYHDDSAFPANDAITAYAAANPAPEGSSGWFFPGGAELSMMCYGMTNKFSARPTARRDFLNGQFLKAGGDPFAETRYWSISDFFTNMAWSLDFKGKTAYGYTDKTESHRVRAVLAF